MKKLIVGFLAVMAMFSLASTALAATPIAQPVNDFMNTANDGGVGSGNPKDQDQSSASPDKSKFQIVSCNPRYNQATGQLDNDCNYNQAIITISRIIRFVLYLLTPVVLAMILWMGFKFLTANGNPGKLADAKKMFTPILLGVFFICAAYLIVYKFILQTLLAPTVGDVSKTDILGGGGN